MNTKPDESAMPIFLQEGLTHHSHINVGLTKREYFAAKAMVGILSADGFAERLATEGGEKTLLKTICTASVMAADALIIELNK